MSHRRAAAPPRPPLRPRTNWRVYATVVALVTALGAVLAVTTRRAPPAGVRGGNASARALRAETVHTYPHDPEAFTQGLVLDGSVLYESTGLEGRSSLRRVDLQTGRVLAMTRLPDEVFGEGLAQLPGTLIQLTWKHGMALLYDPQTLALQRRVPYRGEGWGLCYDGASVVMSDGSDRLTWRRPDTFEIQRTAQVTLDGSPLDKLNELECVNGNVYANVWHTDMIVHVDAASGRVIDRIDASGLFASDQREAVLNGIAHDPADGLFYITGKLWPRLFKVRFVSAPA